METNSNLTEEETRALQKALDSFDNADYDEPIDISGRFIHFASEEDYESRYDCEKHEYQIIKNDDVVYSEEMDIEGLCCMLTDGCRAFFRNDIRDCMYDEMEED